jgi:outer membrane protein OmpU
MRLIKQIAISAATIIPTYATSAAEIKPGAGLDITISGTASFLVAYGALNEKPNLGENFQDLNNYDFLNDFDVNLLVRGINDNTGIEYGAFVEFDADTNRFENTEETWVFVRGGFGELRFGDTGSAANELKIGAYTVAVGTGGVDGTVLYTDLPVIVDFSERGTLQNPEEGTLNSTKIVYFSPIYNGFQIGMSYTPEVSNMETDGGIVAINRGDRLTIEVPNAISDEIAAGLAYSGSFGPFDLRTSVVGAIAAHDPGRTYVIYTGALVGFGDFTLAGGAGIRERSNRYSMNDPDPERVNLGQSLERYLYNIGAAYRLDRYAFSVNYAAAQSNVKGASLNTSREARESALIFGFEVGLLPGLTFSTELGHYSRKQLGEAGNETADPDDKDNDGWIGVTALTLNF